MSLLEELESRGVTAEDLEKAASVRLFEKAAAAEGVDLDSLDVDQVEELYTSFLSNQSYTDDNTKEASAMNDEIVDLFEKTAAAEGIDLDDMADAELAELYNHYVENVLPEQLGDAMLDDDHDKEASHEDEDAAIFDMFQKTAAAEGLDLNEFSQYELNEMYDHYVNNVLPFQMGDKVAMAEVEEAQEKLAEAEILGRHMARAYMDEMDKEAKQPKQIEGSRFGMGARLRELATGHQAAGERAAAKIKGSKSTLGVSVAERKQLAKEMKAATSDSGSPTRVHLSEGARRTANRLKAQRGVHRVERLKGYGKRGLAVGAAGTLAYGAKKMMDKKSSADDIYELAYERAEEFAKVGSVEDYDGSFIDDIACDILGEHGYYLVD